MYVTLSPEVFQSPVQRYATSSPSSLTKDVADILNSPSPPIPRSGCSSARLSKPSSPQGPSQAVQTVHSPSELDLGEEPPREITPVETFQIPQEIPEANQVTCTVEVHDETVVDLAEPEGRSESTSSVEAADPPADPKGLGNPLEDDNIRALLQRPFTPGPEVHDVSSMRRLIGPLKRQSRLQQIPPQKPKKELRRVPTNTQEQIERIYMSSALSKKDNKAGKRKRSTENTKKKHLPSVDHLPEIKASGEMNMTHGNHDTMKGLTSRPKSSALSKIHPMGAEPLASQLKSSSKPPQTSDSFTMPPISTTVDMKKKPQAKVAPLVVNRSHPLSGQGTKSRGTFNIVPPIGNQVCPSPEGNDNPAFISNSPEHISNLAKGPSP